VGVQPPRRKFMAAKRQTTDHDKLDKKNDFDADSVSKDDPHKTEKLAKAGRDIDTNTGQE
jgi:hypothetical protein